jgi:ligand-binding sensor domain-containing protein
MKKKIVFLLFILQPFFLFLEAQNAKKIKFHRLPAGISNNLVSNIFQDKKGFMWFGTSNGLNRFDGYSFKVYEHNPLDTNSITNTTIRYIFEDKQENLWICTDGGGFSFFDQKTEKFINYRDNKKRPSSSAVEMVMQDKQDLFWFALSDGLNSFNAQTQTFEYFTQKQTNYQGGRATGIYEDEDGYIWLTTTEQGLARFDKKTKKFQYFTKENTGLKDNSIRVFAKSKQKNKYWIGYRLSGLSLISIQNGQVKVEKSYRHIENDPQSMMGNDVESLLEDSQGRLWVGIENDGLSILDLKNETFTNYKHDSSDEYSLSNDSPWAIYEDRFGNIWIGTFSQGVNVVYNQYHQKFEHYYQKSGDQNSLVNNNVSAFFEQEDGKIWIATDGGGLSLWDRNANSFMNFTANNPAPYKISANAVLSIAEDSQKNIWFGTWEGGVNIFNPKTKSFSLLNTQNSKISGNTHFTFFKAKDNIMYMGAWESFIDAFDTQKKQLIWSVNLAGSNFKYIFKIFEDSKQNLWVITAKGVVLIPKENKNDKGKYKFFNHLDNQPNSLSQDGAFDIYEDQKGNIWITTISGFNLYRPQTQDFKIYRKSDGLVNDEVRGIMADELGFLWLITAKGLSKFDPQKELFENFVQEDGLQGNEFSRKAIYKTSKGELLIGGNNGFNIFDPAKLIKNPFAPAVYFEDFKLFNKPLQIGTKDSPLKQHITYTQEITLSHTQSVFTIEYVALNYIRPEKNQYAYILEGFEKEWNYVGNKREATYTSLPAGTYTFKVKATNNDGIWSEEVRSLKIVILPPWWETWWFRTLVISLIAITTIIGINWRVRAIEAQKAHLEKLVQKRTQELEEKNTEIMQQTFELKEKNDEVLQQAEELHQQAEELITQRDYIQGQNMQLAGQNKVMEEKSRQIRQSINAAQTIQQAILPHPEKLDRLLGDYFVLYQPKDVVSGDFYWLSQVENQTILVIADCTGHGVPGAFMTLIGNSILDKLVKVLKIINPAEILTQLHHEVYDKLKQEFSGNNYGMDAIVLNISASENGVKKIIFAGAKNSIYCLAAGNEQKVQEFKGSRRAIGGHQNEEIIFENQEVTLPKNSMVYVGTDGYVDQNNAKRKKMGYEKFIQLICQNADLPLNQQKLNFQKILEEHSQGTLQRDDILLMGIRV